MFDNNITLESLKEKFIKGDNLNDLYEMFLNSVR